MINFSIIEVIGIYRDLVKIGNGLKNTIDKIHEKSSDIFGLTEDYLGETYRKCS